MTAAILVERRLPAKHAASDHYRIFYFVSFGFVDHAWRPEIFGGCLHAFVSVCDGVVCHREPAAENQASAVASTIPRDVPYRLCCLGGGHDRDLGNARLNQAYLVVFLEYLVPTVLHRYDHADTIADSGTAGFLSG